MNEKTLFQLALGLTEPWFVSDTKFDPAAKRLDLFLDFKRGHAFLEYPSKFLAARPMSCKALNSSLIPS